MNITIDTKAEQVQRALEQLGSRSRVVTRRALNRTLKNVTTELTKRLGKRVALKAADIKDVLSPREATNEDLTAILEVLYVNHDGDRGKGSISLKRYGARRRGRGGGRAPISVQILRGEGRKPVRAGFIVDSLGGHVFARRGPKRKMTRGTSRGQMKQPISKLYGPSIRVEAEPILAELRASGWVTERLLENLRQQAGGVLSGAVQG